MGKGLEYRQENRKLKFHSHKSLYENTDSTNGLFIMTKSGSNLKVNQLKDKQKLLQPFDWNII